jgi:DNA-directed RNA polymerase specialized sigma24 family protein
MTVRESFDNLLPLAYFLARKRVISHLARVGVEALPDRVAELAQDTVCRAYDKYGKRCRKSPPADDATVRKYVIQATVYAARDAVRSKSTFGSISSPAAIQNDAFHRYKRTRPDGIHGTDEERALLDPPEQPVSQEAQGWEVRQLAEENLPADLVDTAVFAASGIDQELSAKAQGCTSRTVRNRLAQIRGILDPRTNIYAVICAALRDCLRG